MTSLLLDFARDALGLLFIGYTTIAISHYVVQLFYAHRTYRRQASPEFERLYPPLPVDVDILVPSYNEEPKLLEDCVRSGLNQDHPGRVRVIVIDDGSPNRDVLDPVYDALEREGAIIIRSPENVGKRHAQALGLKACQGEIIVTLDSDSILQPDAVRHLTRQFRDPRIGAATGFVDVENYRKNLLTRLQRLRYWMAFNQERAAQSWFRTILCCSGPLAAYRREILNRVSEAYLSQTYGGVPCTYGDDRHLTNLVLGEGYDTVFDSGAVAFTHVPERFRQFVRQQLRWSKSFYRELVWTLPYIGQRPWYSRFDVASSVVLPLVLPVTASTALLLGTLESPTYVLRFLAMIAAVGAVRATYGVLRHRDLGFYLFVAYGFISAFVLMPIRLRALWTLTDARWGTRGPAPTGGRRWSLSGLLKPNELSLAAAGAGLVHAGASPVELEVNVARPSFTHRDTTAAVRPLTALYPESRGAEGILRPRSLTEPMADAIVAYAIEHPMASQRRIARGLASELYGGRAASGRHVARVLRGSGLGRRLARIAAVDSVVASEAGPRTAEVLRRHQVAEQAKPTRARLDLPGENLHLDTMFVGRFEGVGSVWQLSAVDAASSFAIARVVATDRMAEAMARFLTEDVVPTCRRAGLVVRTATTDHGPEFGRSFVDACRASAIHHRRVPAGWNPAGLAARFEGTVLYLHYRHALDSRHETTLDSIDRELQSFLRFYNFERPHPRHGTAAPATLFFGEQPEYLKQIGA